MRHIYVGLKCMHAHEVAHGNIQAENILFDCKSIKIVDYSFSCIDDPDDPDYCNDISNDDVLNVGLIFENFLVAYATEHYRYDGAPDDVYDMFDLPKISVLRWLIAKSANKTASDMVKLIDAAD
jgi:serine/threonine protein kinase